MTTIYNRNTEGYYNMYERVADLLEHATHKSDRNFGEQFHKMNARVFWSCESYINAFDPETFVDGVLIISYQTPVAFVDTDNKVFYELRGYSKTTSKQCTCIYNEYFITYDRIIVRIG